MKKILFLTAFICSYLTQSISAIEFEKYFDKGSCRVDFNFTGDSHSTATSLNQVYHEPFWGGRTTFLDVDAGLGDFRFKVLDEASSEIIYTDGFSALFHEWQSTPEADSIIRSYEQTLLFPFPKSAVRVVIEKRTDYRKWQEIGNFKINPADKLIRIKTPEVENIKKWIVEPDVSKAIDIAIIAEGYTEKEIAKFYGDASVLKSQILSHEPFKSYSGRINFYAVGSISKESGISAPQKDIWKNTVLSSHYHTFYAPRYLTTEAMFKTRDMAASVPYDALYILANSTTYGGGGIYNHYALTSSDGPKSVYVTVHEFGHSFAGLGDEYFREGSDVLDGMYDVNQEPWEPNLTTLKIFDEKWKDMIAPGTQIPTPKSDSLNVPVGVYEGGGYLTKGVYRPAFDCRMRTNTAKTFCPVCRKAVEDRIKFLTGGKNISKEYKKEEFSYRTIDKNERDSNLISKCKLDVYFPVGEKNLTTILFFHGGGLTSGGKYIPEPFLNKNVIVVSADYRLSPAVKCPAYLEDAAAAVAWTFKNIGKFGGTPEKIFISGMSAGAYLSTMLYLDKEYLKPYGLDPDQLKGLFSFSGQMTTHFQICKEQTGVETSSATTQIDKYAALNYVRKTNKKIEFYTGDSLLDMPGRYVQNKEICRKLTELGNHQVVYREIKGHDHASFERYAEQDAIYRIQTEN